MLRQSFRFVLYGLLVLLCISSLVLGFLITPSFIHDYCIGGLPAGSSVEHCNLDNFSGVQLKFVVFSFIWLAVLVLLIVFQKDFFSLKLPNAGRFFRWLKKDYLEDRFHYWFLAFIVLVGICLRLFYSTVPMKTDESATYVWYASWPVYISQSLYTFPNNHLLNTLLVKISTTLFGVSELSIRLPDLIFGILCIIVSYFVGRRFFNKHIGLLLCTFVAVSGFFVAYSIEARGYSIIAFFALTSILLVPQLSKGGFGSWLLLALLLALSVYTVPTMLYFAFLTGCWILYLNRKNLFELSFIKNGFLFSAVFCLLVIILYYPVILLSGIKSVIANKYVISLSFDFFIEGLPSYLDDLISSIYLNFPLSVYVWLTLSLFGLFLLNWSHIKKGCPKRRKRAIIPLLNIFIPILFLLMCAQRVLPFSRTFIYLFPLFYLLISFVIMSFIRLVASDNKVFARILLFSFCCLILLFGVIGFDESHLKFDYVGDSRSASYFLLDNSGDNTCFVLSSTRIYASFMYYMTKEKFYAMNCRPDTEYDTIYLVNNTVLKSDLNFSLFSGLEGSRPRKMASYDRNEIWLYDFS